MMTRPSLVGVFGWRCARCHSVRRSLRGTASSDGTLPRPTAASRAADQLRRVFSCAFVQDSICNVWLRLELRQSAFCMQNSYGKI